MLSFCCCYSVMLFGACGLGSSEAAAVCCDASLLLLLQKYGATLFCSDAMVFELQKFQCPHRLVLDGFVKIEFSCLQCNCFV